MKEILDFLKDLELNNNREWFDKNRDRYDASRKKFLAVAELLIHEIRQFDKEIASLQGKDCVFRIFRDVRFSNDKRPFKTNFGCFIARGGRKSGYSGYYLHVQPGENFVSGGIYMPPPEFLQAIREEIYYQPQSYLNLIEDPRFKEVYTQNYFEALKTAPKGYPKDWPLIDLLKPRHFAWGHPVSDSELTDPQFLNQALEWYQVIHPMNAFLNRAVDDNRK